ERDDPLQRRAAGDGTGGDAVGASRDPGDPGRPCGGRGEQAPRPPRRVRASGPAARRSRRAGASGPGWLMKTDTLTIGGRSYPSRLIVGTGKYPNLDIMRLAIEASGAALVTVAVRRVDLSQRGGGRSLLDYIDTARVALLPNTAGCSTADE